MCVVYLIKWIQKNLSTVISTMVCLVTFSETRFTTETPTVFCGPKHFTHPSIGLVVSRWGVYFHFLVNYPFKIVKYIYLHIQEIKQQFIQ